MCIYIKSNDLRDVPSVVSTPQLGALLFTCHSHFNTRPHTGRRQRRLENSGQGFSRAGGECRGFWALCLVKGVTVSVQT